MVALVNDERVSRYRSGINLISTEKIYKLRFCRGSFLRWNKADIVRCSARGGLRKL